MKVMAVDPGVSTGVVWTSKFETLFRGDPKYGYLQIKERPEHKSILKLLSGIESFQPQILVIESFQLGGTRSTKAEVLAPVRIAAVVHFVVTERLPMTEIVWQTPSDKSTQKDERLDHYGVLIKPKYPNRHANDAMRHLLKLAMDRKVI